jgi:hypothetical protein
MPLSPELVGFIHMIALQVAADPAAIQVKDMVLVEDAARPFLIDVFEMSYTDAGQKANNPTKAARLETLEQAKEACKAAGKRVPTDKEWLAAASALGKNRTYTLLGDEIFAQPKEKQGLKVRLGGSNSTPTREFAALGIDAIGTVGMTGNRAEWTVGASEKPVQCGFGYESKVSDYAFAELKNICTNDDSKWSAQADKKTATVRCVMDVEKDKAYQITYSDDVSGELKDHITSITAARYDRWANGSPAFRVSTNIFLVDQLLINQRDVEQGPRVNADGATTPPDATFPAATPPAAKPPKKVGDRP